MPIYRIVWSNKLGGSGEKTVNGAAMAYTWVAELRDKGADSFAIYRDEKVISEDDLPELIKAEAEAKNTK